MSSPSVATVKRLFAVSYNRCAFPDCETPLVSESGKVTGRICHIEGKRGPRYNPVQSPEERDGYHNLLLLCALHHDIVDADVTTYTVERLHEMKREHESSPPERLSLSDAAAAALIGNVTMTNESGPVLASTGQTGGQFAHTITNIVHGGSVGAPGSSAPRPASHREADALLDLWEQLLLALSAVLDATVNLAPLAGQAKRQACDTLAQVTFPSLATGSELSAWEAVQNDYLHVMAFPYFGNNATAAIDDLEHCATRARLIVPLDVATSVREIACQMRTAVKIAREAKTSVEQWRSVMLAVQAIEQAVVTTEGCVKAQLQTGGG